MTGMIVTVVVLAFGLVGLYMHVSNQKIKIGKMQDYIDEFEGNPTHDPSKRKRKF